MHNFLCKTIKNMVEEFGLNEIIFRIKFIMSQDEIVVIVDEKNNIIAAETRSEMRSKGLIHRAAYILVFNSLEVSLCRNEP